MAQQTVQQVTKIVAQQLGINESEITPTARFGEELGMDSLDAVEITIEIEEQFQVTISDDDAAQLTSVNAIVAYLERAGK